MGTNGEQKEQPDKQAHNFTDDSGKSYVADGGLLDGLQPCACDDHGRRPDARTVTGHADRWIAVSVRRVLLATFHGQPIVVSRDGCILSAAAVGHDAILTPNCGTDLSFPQRNGGPHQRWPVKQGNLRDDDLLKEFQDTFNRFV